MYYTVLYNAPRPPHLFRSLSKYLPCDSKARRVLRRIVRRIIYILLRDVLCHRPREKRKKGKKKGNDSKKSARFLKRGSEKTFSFNGYLFRFIILNLTFEVTRNVRACAHTHAATHRWQ